MESALECRSLSKRFGGLAALIGVDLRVGKGDIFGVIGPNGSGKTTLFNLISGTLKPTSGEIHFEGRKNLHSCSGCDLPLGNCENISACSAFWSAHCPGKRLGIGLLRQGSVTFSESASSRCSDRLGFCGTGAQGS